MGRAKAQRGKGDRGGGGGGGGGGHHARKRVQSPTGRLEWAPPAAIRTPEHQETCRRVLARGRPIRFSAGDVVALGLMPAQMCGSQPMEWRRALAQFLTAAVVDPEPVLPVPAALWVVADAPPPTADERRRLQEQCLRALDTLAHGLLPTALRLERQEVYLSEALKRVGRRGSGGQSAAPRSDAGALEWGDEPVRPLSPTDFAPLAPIQEMAVQVCAALREGRVPAAVRMALRCCAAASRSASALAAVIESIAAAPEAARLQFAQHLDRLPEPCGSVRRILPATSATAVGERWEKLRPAMEKALRWDGRLLDDDYVGPDRACVVLRAFQLGGSAWAKVAVAGTPQGALGWVVDIPMAACNPAPEPRARLQRVRIAAGPAHMRKVQRSVGKEWQEYKGEAAGCAAVLTQHDFGEWFYLAVARGYEFSLPAAVLRPIPESAADLLALVADASVGQPCSVKLLLRLPVALQQEHSLRQAAWRVRVDSLALSLGQTQLLRRAMELRDWAESEAASPLPAGLYGALSAYPPWDDPATDADTISIPDECPSGTAAVNAVAAALASAAVTPVQPSRESDPEQLLIPVGAPPPRRTPADGPLFAALSQLCSDAVVARHGTKGRLTAAGMREVFRTLQSSAAKKQSVRRWRVPTEAACREWFEDMAAARAFGKEGADAAQLWPVLMRCDDQSISDVSAAFGVPFEAASGAADEYPTPRLVSAEDVPSVPLELRCGRRGCDAVVIDGTAGREPDGEFGRRWCQSCLSVKYCCGECQEADWVDRHADECGTLSRLQPHGPRAAPGAGFQRFATNLHSHCSYCQVELKKLKTRPLLCWGCDAVVACSLRCVQEHDAVPGRAPGQQTRLHDLCWHFRLSWAPASSSSSKVLFDSAAESVQGLRNDRLDRLPCPCGHGASVGPRVCSGCLTQSFCDEQCLELYGDRHAVRCSRLRIRAEAAARELCRSMRRASQHLREIVGDGAVSCQVAGQSEPLTDTSAEVGLGNAWRRDPNWQRCISQLWTAGSVLCVAEPLAEPLEVFRGDLCISVDAAGGLAQTVVHRIKHRQRRSDQSPFVALRRLCACVDSPREFISTCGDCGRACCEVCLCTHECAGGRVDSSEPRMMEMTACICHRGCAAEEDGKLEEIERALQESGDALWAVSAAPGSASSFE